MSSNLSNSDLLIRINKCQQRNRVLSDTEKKKIWWNFQFNYSGKLKVLCIKSGEKIHKILTHKIQQAPTEFFSETSRK